MPAKTQLQETTSPEKQTPLPPQHYPLCNVPPRFVTSHPRYMSERVVDAVASLPSLCEVFYLPFQSGDDEVLRRMRRGYSVSTSAPSRVPAGSSFDFFFNSHLIFV